MKFYYDAEKTKELEQKLVDRWVKTQLPRGNELHVYDVTYCNVKAYNRLTGVKPYFTKQVIGFFVFGVVSQKIIQELFPEDEREFVPEKFLKEIEGHIDVYELKVNPLEIKSSRKRIFKAKDIPQKWVEQLMSYMAKTNRNKGWLIIVNVFSCQLSCFCLELTDGELENQRVIMLYNATQILNAVKNRNPNNLYVSPKEYNACIYKKVCPRRGECKKGKRDKKTLL